MSVQNILENFGVKLKKDVQKNYSKKQREKASKHGSPYNENSKGYDSIRFNISEKNGGFVFELIMADYLYWIDKSREKGGVSEEGQKKIQAWIRTRGINPAKIIEGFKDKKGTKKGTKKVSFDKASKQLTFLISRKLKEKGYEGTGFYSEIYNDGRLKKLKQDLQEELNKEVEIVLKSI